MSLDLSLYWVSDPSSRYGVVPTAVAAVAGGATVIQLRDKHASDEDFIETGLALRAALDPLGVPLVINDRVHTVAAIGAAGAHVGQSDMSATRVRYLLGPDAILGLSIENEGQLDAVDWGAVDYIGAGPVHATPVKPDHAPPFGYEGLARICARSAKPVVAIGGIMVGDAVPVKRAGAHGLAVVAAISDADDPEAAARSLLAAWRQA